MKSNNFFWCHFFYHVMYILLQTVSHTEILQLVAGFSWKSTGCISSYRYKLFLPAAGIFLAVIFWDFSHLFALPIGWWLFFCFVFFVECRVLGLLLCTKSKKYTWCVSLPIVWWKLPEVLLIYLYNLHIYKLRPEGSFEMMLSMSMKD